MIFSENRFPLFGITLLNQHDPFRKPVPTFRDHALAAAHIPNCLRFASAPETIVPRPPPFSRPASPGLAQGSATAGPSFLQGGVDGERQKYGKRQWFEGPALHRARGPVPIG